MEDKVIQNLFSKLTSDHDTIIRLDENVRNLIMEVKLFKDGLISYDNRIRDLEKSLIKLSPIPSVSHEQVINDINNLQKDIVMLKERNDLLSGGWRAILLLGGSFLGILSFIYTAISLFGLLRVK